MTGYLTAKQASQKLGVSLSTLYAYVSRGLIRSEPDTVKRRRRYRAEDVESLLARKSGDSDKQLAQALNWGEPVCESHLTLIEDGELYYRGRWVKELVREATFEDVVEILWEGYERMDPLEIPVEERGLEPLNRFAVTLARCAERDLEACDIRPASVRRTGARILSTLFSTICRRRKDESLAGALAAEWGLKKKSILDAALILCADHELNTSAFTARCVASAGASPYGVVQAGLSALGGFRHGAHTFRVEALFREVEALGAQRAVESYLRRGDELPGFRHQLYPHGDPRGRDLLALLEPMPAMARELVEVAETMNQGRPNVDFALVTLALSLQRPPGAALTLFALGRCAGWIAHALEQYATGKLIRPRARYVGQLPGGL